MNLNKQEILHKHLQTFSKKKLAKIWNSKETATII